jgi:hypothetical protein
MIVQEFHRTANNFTEEVMSPLTLLRHIITSNKVSIRKKADARASMSNKRLQNTEQNRTLHKWKRHHFNPSRVDNNLFKTTGAMFISGIWNVHVRIRFQQGQIQQSLTNTRQTHSIHWSRPPLDGPQERMNTGDLWMTRVIHTQRGWSRHYIRYTHSFVQERRVDNRPPQ